MTDTLRDRVALVTGGSRGIGKGIALALAGAGARVAINFREREADARAVVREIEAAGGRAIAVRADVAEPGAVAELVAAVRAALGPIEILVSNAGIARPAMVDTVDLVTWDAAFATNLRGPFIVSQAVLPEMRARRWGRLIYLSSTASRIGGIVGPHYAASKAGLEGLVHSYASQLARQGITANAIAPALIETEMLASNSAAHADRLPVGRFGTVDEVASLVVAVVGNAFITGQTLQVNGGIYMT